MITFAIGLTGVQREIGYTHIAHIIGKKILRWIYLNDKIEDIDNTGVYTKNSIMIKDKYKHSEFLNIIGYDDEKTIILGTIFLDILSMFPQLRTQ